MMRINSKKIVLFCLPFLLLLLSGCSHFLDDMDLHDETQLPPAYPIDNPPPPKTNGTIYQAGHEISLYEDHLAHRIGDILTVRLNEQTTGQKQAETKANKTSTVTTNNGTTQNNPSASGGGLMSPVLFGGQIRPLVFDTGTDLEFDGKGQTNQNNSLTGTISVTVTRVLSNGNLMIQGESWIVINQGREYIRLTGIVRPEDIDPTDSVSSQRVANARISYSGSGMTGNASRGGFVTQFLYKFFPY